MEIFISIVEISYAIVFAIIFIIICKKIKSTVPESTKTIYYYITLFTWYVLSIGLSLKGFFHSADKYSDNDFIGLIILIVFMMLPITVFISILRKNKNLKALISSIHLPSLISLQTYRIAGVYWIILLIADKAPIFFALPAGIIDIIIGLSAPLIANLAIRKSKSAISVTKLWNYIGLFDFILAFTMYFLYFPFFVLKTTPEKIMWGGFYPTAFIVLFVVPLSIILHIVTLRKIQE